MRRHGKQYMCRLTELIRKLADQKTVIRDLAAQAEHSKGEVTHRLLRKRENVMLAAQTTQNDIDAVYHRIAYLRVAHSRAQENLVALERAGGSEDNRKTVQHEIDGILREIARLSVVSKPEGRLTSRQARPPLVLRKIPVSVPANSVSSAP